MDSAQALIAVIVVALVLIGGVVAIQYSSGDVGKSYSVTETVESGAIGTTTTLNYSNTAEFRYSDRVDVQNASGVQLFDGVDYDWNGQNGTLTPLSDKAANETSLNVTYGFNVPTEEQQATQDIVAYIFNSGAWVPLILAVGTLVLGLAAFGGLRE